MVKYWWAQKLGHDREVGSSHGLQVFELEILTVREKEVGAVTWFGSLNFVLPPGPISRYSCVHDNSCLLVSSVMRCSG
jgi:hypothetical protein